MTSTLASVLRRGVLALAATATVTTFSACSGQCLWLEAPSVFVTVVDAVTGLAPTSTVTVRLSDGTVEETMILNVDPPVPPLPDLPTFVSKTYAAGVFRVTVSASGYQTLVREGVQVTSDGYCGQIRQARVTVRLQPATAP